MTALGKGRVATGKRKYKTPPVEETVYMSEEEEEDEDDSVQDESVTRCTCGELHSVGLMVQCDQCEVWQHCECMGLMEEEDIPDQYYCEQCKPSDHIEVKIGFEKTRRYYKPALPSDFEKKILPKRRTTFNSREASDSWEEILALQTAIEQSKTESSSSSSSSPETPALQHFKAMENEQESDELEAEVAPRRQKQQRTVKKQKLTHKKTSTEKKVKTRKNAAGTRQKKGTRSRTSTPQPVEKRGSSPVEEKRRFIRETSPPAKVRFPTSRMSITDMSRRANHILEYICSLQVAMADDDLSESGMDAQINEVITRAYHRPTIVIPEHPDLSSPSSSLSSASTIPLEEEDVDYTKEMGVAEEALIRNKEQSSMEIMDLLTRHVINFQRKFGPLSDEDTTATTNESDCGPTTRSKELSHRSMMERAW